MRKLIPLSCLILIILTGCSHVCSVREGGVQHVVVCWLKEPGNAEQRQRIIDASYTFREIPGVLLVHAGVPLPSERPIVDDSFDVAITITLADVQALEDYQVHPLHITAKKDVLAPYVAKVVVYDFVE